MSSVHYALSKCYFVFIISIQLEKEEEVTVWQSTSSSLGKIPGGAQLSLVCVHGQVSSPLRVSASSPAYRESNSCLLVLGGVLSNTSNVKVPQFVRSR